MMCLFSRMLRRTLVLQQMGTLTSAKQLRNGLKRMRNHQWQIWHLPNKNILPNYTLLFAITEWNSRQQ